jgi:hypothetical protein
MYVRVNTSPVITRIIQNIFIKFHENVQNRILKSEHQKWMDTWEAKAEYVLNLKETPVQRTLFLF